MMQNLQGTASRMTNPTELPILSVGERIIWQGAPKPGIWLESADAFAIPFTILWLGIVVVINAVALTSEVSEVDPLAYVILPLFLAIGIYMAIGRFFVARLSRSRTRYFLTDRRAIIREGIFRTRERSVNLAATGEIRIGAIKESYATIEFGMGSPLYRMMPRSWGMGQSGLLAPAFEKIKDAEQVYRKAIELQHGS